MMILLLAWTITVLLLQLLITLYCAVRAGEASQRWLRLRRRCFLMALIKLVFVLGSGFRRFLEMVRAGFSLVGLVPAISCSAGRSLPIPVHWPCLAGAMFPCVMPFLSGTIFSLIRHSSR